MHVSYTCRVSQLYTKVLIVPAEYIYIYIIAIIENYSESKQYLLLKPAQIYTCERELCVYSLFTHEQCWHINLIYTCTRMQFVKIYYLIPVSSLCV